MTSIRLKYLIVVAMATLLMLAVSSVYAQPTHHLNGLVFIDLNQNGQWDEGEKGYEGIYRVTEKSDHWTWGYHGTYVSFEGVGSGIGEPIMLQTAGRHALQAGEVDPCSRQGDGRPCDGTFGMVSYAQNMWWDVTLTVPPGYRLTTPGTQMVRSGVVNQPIDFGIVPVNMPPAVDTQPVYLIAADGSENVRSGGTATLTRTPNGISVSFDGVNMPNGHVVTLWAYTFNNPLACNFDGCDQDDVFANGMTPPLISNPNGTVGRAGVDFTLLGLGGHVIGQQGTTPFTGMIAKDTAPQVVFGNGLKNPMTAEIHFALRDHGPAAADSALRNQQLTVGNGGCQNFGGTGTYMCRDFQIAIFGQ